MLWTKEALLALALYVQTVTAQPMACIAERESGFDALAVGAAGEIGVVQWLPTTHEWLAELFRERANMNHPLWSL